MEPNKVSYESMLEGRDIALTQHEDVYSESIKAVCHFSMFNNTTYMSCESKDRIRQQYYTVGFSTLLRNTDTETYILCNQLFVLGESYHGSEDGTTRLKDQNERFYKDVFCVGICSCFYVRLINEATNPAYI